MLKLGLRTITLSLAASTTLSAGIAAAEPSASVPDQGSNDAARGAGSEQGLRGFELMARPGWGSAGSDSPVVYQQAPLAYHPDPGAVYDGSAAPYGGGFVGQLSAGYRFLPVASVGAWGELRSSSAKAPNDGTSELQRSGFGVGLYLRGYAPMLHPKLDPYAEIGVGYMKDRQTYRRGVATTIGSMPGDWTLDHHGIAVPLAIGIDYRVLPSLAIGPSFRYAYVFGAGACLGESVDTPLGAVSSKSCSDASANQRVTKAESYGVWSAGLDMRVTL